MKSSYYGFTIYYRIENRKNGAAWILSYRGEDPDGKIIYEHPPRCVKNGEAVLAGYKTDYAANEHGQTIFEAELVSLAKDFAQGMLGLNKEETRERNLMFRKSLGNLPLGMLLSADSDEILGNGTERKRESIDDDRRAIKTLLIREGRTPWREVSQTHCAKWLADISSHSERACIRVMCKLFEIQCEAGVVNFFPWQRAPLGQKSQLPNNKNLTNAHIEPRMLTDEQCRVLIRRCTTRAENGVITGVDVALMLRLIQGIELEELCALDLSDFSYLYEFRERMSVRIHRVLVKGTKNYMRKEIDDSYRKRRLGLAHVVKECVDALKARRGNKDGPLLPCKANAKRRMTPRELQAKLKKVLRDEKIEPRQVTQGKAIRLKDPLQLLASTGRAELRKAGYEEEELRHTYGLMPQLTSAVSYCDYESEAEMNKLGALQDRWLRRFAGEHEKYSKRMAKGVTQKISAKQDGMRTETDIILDFSSVKAGNIPAEGIWIECGALHGMSGFAGIIKK